MSSFKSASKAVGQLITSKHSGRRFMRPLQSNLEPENCVQTQARCFKTVGNVKALPFSSQIVGGSHKHFPFSQNMSASVLIQRRRFLGCGDGDEGSNVLSKVHEEKRIMGYSQEQLFAVVAAVDMYQDFLPWCQRSDIIKRHMDSSFDAELIASMFFKEVVTRLVSSFNERCLLIYGPGVSVHEETVQRNA